MSDVAADGKPNYGTYWKAWAFLLVVTIAMFFIENPMVVIVGITVKALVILTWFMHLKEEHRDISLTVGIGVFATALVMYYLMAFDAAGM
mgnify:CR=1 FL=1